MMRVFVVGHRGMLGHVVARYFREVGFEVLTSEKRYTGVPSDALVSDVIQSDADWVVNAIAKSAKTSASTEEMMRINAQFPVHLKSFLGSNQQMIHASSDGVFSGKTGNYTVNARRDADDAYGVSKILGEIVAEEGKSIVLRTSIIGPEIGAGSSLFAWFFRQTGTIQGFTNHFWNGVTTLEWAKVATEVINRGLRPNHPILQPAVKEVCSKFELLETLNSVFAKNLQIKPIEEPTRRIDRSLSADPPRSPLKQQLEELKQWYPL
jgi:dTDP-4-dehydrorhamnose reductase